MNPQAGAQPRSPSADVLGIATYLASSWTWCIGMFLPVLLVRDLGLWAFLVFAIPNCAGAALMGWVLRRPGASEALVASHRSACVWFSRITVAFHAFFLMWMVQRTGVGWAVIAGFITNLLTGALAAWRNWPGWAPAALTYAASVAAAGVMAWSGSLGADIPSDPLLPVADLFWLAPVCVFGFVFCPYLDLTFHEARRVLPGPAGTRAFVAGFGGFFLIMIVLTLAYAGMFLRTDPSLGLDPSAGPLAATLATVSVAALVIHLSAQSAFTMQLHLGMIAGARTAPRRGIDLVTALVAAVAMITGICASLIPAVGGFFTNLPPVSGGEAVYRSFMAFYGLVFPAYVWICMLPMTGEAARARLPRRRVLAFAAAVGIAAPMFYMGFIERQTLWLGPGLGVVLAARWLARPPKAA